MRGFRKMHRSSVVVFWTVSTALLFCFITGCAGSKESEVRKIPAASVKDFLAKYEKTFNPSQYDPDLSLIRQEENEQYTALEAVKMMTTVAPETIPGFRIQVLFTQEIDQANQLRDSIETLLPQEWAYIIYDAPYYKVRVGNYEERNEANPLLKRLNTMGFRDAWIVPDNIFRNIPPKPPEIDIVPERQIEQHK
jgi:hypothetical protein